MDIQHLIETVGLIPAAIIFGVYQLKEAINKIIDCKFNNNVDGKYIGDPYILYKLVSGMVSESSRGKLSQIKGILLANHIKGREEEIKMKIRNLLEERTMVYIEYFNNEVKCEIERLGDFYSEAFDTEHFFAQVMDVVYQERDEDRRIEQVAVAIDHISNIMVSYQREANNKVLQKANELYNKK